MLIFYASKIIYCRHWKTWWTMFPYFWCRWIFKIIFTTIKLFYYTLKISINNNWCFTRFLILTKLYILVSSEGITTLQKPLFLNTLLWDSIFFLFRKKTRNSDNKNHNDVQKLFLLIMLVVFWLQDNAPLLSSFEIIKRIACFSRVELCFET